MESGMKRKRTNGIFLYGLFGALWDLGLFLRLGLVRLEGSKKLLELEEWTLGLILFLRCFRLGSGLYDE
jgi:hypothetical protein